MPSEMSQSLRALLFDYYRHTWAIGTVFSNIESMCSSCNFASVLQDKTSLQAEAFGASADQDRSDTILKICGLLHEYGILWSEVRGVE